VTRSEMPSPTWPLNRRDALLAATLLVGAASSGCDPLCLAKGKLVVPMAPQDLKCAVHLRRTYDGSFREGPHCRVDDSKPEGDPDYWVVHPGDSFQCMTIPGLKGQKLDISAACPGFEPVNSASFEWNVQGFTCRQSDIGVLTVDRRVLQ